MNNLQKHYKEKVVPALKEKFGYKNIFAVPAIKKVVINVGIGPGLKDQEYLAAVKSTVSKITGQKPVETLSKKSISNFKIREGMVIGVKVTLRGKRMWDFLEKLVTVTLPRIRDFRGIPNTGFDQRGNYSLGFKDNSAFPEVKQEDIGHQHGLEICLATTSNNPAEGRALLVELGFPFRTEEK